ncbi:MAG: mechanosensitive ion channel [Acidobacteriota bacterium]|nr:MAG: mechanosensitive ion channel [Acidobacteriota bacterium]
MSFGLGTRDIKRNIIAGFYAKKIFRVGDAVEIRGERGGLKAISAVQTVDEVEDRTVAVANSVFLDETVKQWPESA